MTMPHCWENLVPSDELARQDPASRHDPRGTRPTLLMVDLHNRVFGDRREPLDQSRVRFPLSCGEAGWETLPALETLLGAARAAGIPVVHTTGEPRIESQIGRTTNLLASGDPGDQAWGLDFVEPLGPVPGELVVHKPMASAFFGTGLMTYLHRLGVDTLIVAGETTSGCIRATVVDAYSCGFGVLIVEDGVFDRSDVSHKINLYDMHLKYGEACHLDRVLDYIGRWGI